MMAVLAFAFEEVETGEVFEADRIAAQDELGFL